MQQAEDRRQRLQEQLSAVAGAAPLPRPDWRLLERQARRKLDDWRGLLGRHLYRRARCCRNYSKGRCGSHRSTRTASVAYRFEGAVKVGDCWPVVRRHWWYVPGRTRTAGLPLRRRSLYPLSYGDGMAEVLFIVVGSVSSSPLR